MRGGVIALVICHVHIPCMCLWKCTVPIHNSSIVLWPRKVSVFEHDASAHTSKITWTLGVKHAWYGMNCLVCMHP